MNRADHADRAILSYVILLVKRLLYKERTF